MPTNHTLVFTDEDMLILDRALVSLPYKDVVGLIQKINQQLQQKPAMESVIE